jgi:DNA-binding CsgD family transcriptional regulator
VTKDYFNSAIIVSIGLFNFVNQILEHKDIIQRSYLTIPFILISFLIYHNKTSKITKSILFFLIGIAYQIAVIDQTDLGASVFFILAYQQNTNKKYGLLLAFSSLIVIVIKSTFSEATPSQTIVAIMAFLFLYGNIYMKHQEYKSKIADLQKQIREKNKPKAIIRNIDVIDITEEEKAIIKLFCNGMSYDNISRFLGINNANDTIRRKITKVKNDNDICSDAKLGKWLFESV